MKTISYIKDNSAPALSGNPFCVSSLSLKMVLPGRVVIVETGIKLELLEGMTLRVVESVNKNFSILAVFVREGEICLNVCSCGNDDMYFIRPCELLAKIGIVETVYDSVRFVDMTSGSRKMYGGPSPTSIQ